MHICRGARFPLCHEPAKEKWRHNHGFYDFNLYREYHLKMLFLMISLIWQSTKSLWYSSQTEASLSCICMCSAPVTYWAWACAWAWARRQLTYVLRKGETRALDCLFVIWPKITDGYNRETDGIFVICRCDEADHRLRIATSSAFETIRRVDLGGGNTKSTSFSMSSNQPVGLRQFPQSRVHLRITCPAAQAVQQNGVIRSKCTWRIGLHL